MKFKRISDNYKYQEHSSYDAQCKCGHVKRVRASVKVSDITTCKRCTLIERNKTILAGHKGVGCISRTFYNYFKGGAKRRGIDYKVTIEALDKLAIMQNYKCALSGLDIVFPQSCKGDGNYNHKPDPNNASLDRIDSSLPYSNDNVQWVHKSVNIMKNGFSDEEFIWFCHKVASCHDNPELSFLKGNRKVKKKVQRLEGEDIPTDNPSTSAQPLIEKGDDIV